MFKAILFDLDGTLLDTLADISNSMNAVLSSLSFPTHPLEDYRYFIGDGIDSLVRRTLPKDQLDENTIKETIVATKDQYRRRWAESSKPYPQVVEMLSELDRRSIPKVILSNKPDEFTHLVVEKLLPGFSFEIVRGVSAATPKKPDPFGALTIAKELQIEPADFLYLGDTNTDMITAIAASMYPAGALWGFREADELLANGAKTLLETPLQLLELLD